MTIISRQISFNESATKCPTSTNVPAAQSPSVPPIPFPLSPSPNLEHLLMIDPAVYYAHLAGNRARAHDPSRDRDDDSSGSGAMQSGRSGAMDINVSPLRPIHANIQGSMWWM